MNDPPKAPIDRAKPLISVVDGDSAVRDSFAVLLEGVGYEVRAFASGLDFLVGLSESAGDCLLTDMHLPDLDGPALMEKVDASGLRLPTILMVTQPRLLAGLGGRYPDVAAILQKPIREDCLFSAIETALGHFAGSDDLSTP